MSPERETYVIKRCLDLSRIAMAAGVAGGLGVGLAVAFVRQAQGTRHVGPTSATLDEAFSAFFGASVGIAVGSALCALSVRRGSRIASGLLAGLAAFVFVLVPAFISTDDVNLGEDLSRGSLAFLALLLLPVGVFALLGASVGRFIDSLAHRARTRKRHQQ